MITLATQAHVPRVSAKAAFEFFANLSDRTFQAWWPGVHLRMRSFRRTPAHVGDLYSLDQWIGKYRVKATEVIVEVVPGRKLVRQVVKVVRLPVRIVMEFDDAADGVTITHTIYAGFGGLGRVCDPLFRLCFFSDGLAAAMDEHLREEFALLPNQPAIADAATS